MCTGHWGVGTLVRSLGEEEGCLQTFSKRILSKTPIICCQMLSLLLQIIIFFAPSRIRKIWLGTGMIDEDCCVVKYGDRDVLPWSSGTSRDFSVIVTSWNGEDEEDGLARVCVDDNSWNMNH